jgi:hypothetical protein
MGTRIHGLIAYACVTVKKGVVVQIALVAYVIVAVVQIIAAANAIQHFTNVSRPVGWVIAIFVGWIPVFGTAIGVYGAHVGWEWSFPASIFLFFGIPVLSVCCALTIESDFWSGRLATLAQVVTTFVVIFGYFYTVVPVFQKEKLAEDNARLQGANDDATIKLNSTNGLLFMADTELTLTTASLTQVEKERGELQATLDDKTRRDAALSAKLASNEVQLAMQAKALITAQRRLLAVDFTWAADEWQIRRNVSRPADEDGKFILQAQYNWPEPYEDLLQALKDVETKDSGRHFYSAAMLDGLHQMIEAKKSELKCEPFDSSMLNTYQMGLAEREREAALATSQSEKIHGAGEIASFQIGYLKTLNVQLNRCLAKESSVVDFIAKEYQ